MHENIMASQKQGDFIGTYKVKTYGTIQKTRNGDVKTVDIFQRVKKHHQKMPNVSINSPDKSVRGV